jgi:hypothetical protein
MSDDDFNVIHANLGVTFLMPDFSFLVCNCKTMLNPFTTRNLTPFLIESFPAAALLLALSKVSLISP